MENVTFLEDNQIQQAFGALIQEVISINLYITIASSFNLKGCSLPLRIGSIRLVVNKQTEEILKMNLREELAQNILDQRDNGDQELWYNPQLGELTWSIPCYLQESWNDTSSSIETVVKTSMTDEEALEAIFNLIIEYPNDMDRILV